MGEPGGACNGFCHQQARQCIRLAEISKTPAHHLAFLRMAEHWNAIAQECDGKLHRWTEWCHRHECVDAEQITAASPFVAQFIGSYLMDETDPQAAANAYHGKEDKKG